MTMTIGAVASSRTVSANLPPVAGVSASTGVTAAQTVTTASFTPPANSTMFLALAFQQGSSFTPAVAITDTAGGSWTVVSLSAGTHTFGAGFLTYYGVYRRTTLTGASPSAMTVTVDPISPGTNTFFTTVRTFTYPTTTASVVRSANASTAGAAATTTLTLAAAPSASNITIACPGANVDTPFSAQPVPSGWTALMNAVPTSYAVMAVFYKDGNTSTTFTSGTMGVSPNSNGGVILELAP